LLTANDLYDIVHPRHVSDTRSTQKHQSIDMCMVLHDNRISTVVSVV